MPISFLFWMLMIIWFIFGIVTVWPADPKGARAWFPVGGTFLIFVLLFLLGWKVFGFVIQG